MQKKIINPRIKNKFKYKRKQKNKQKKNKYKIILKPITISILILSYASFYSFDIVNIPLHKEFNETDAFKEILSFEKNVILPDRIFYDFRHINIKINYLKKK